MSSSSGLATDAITGACTDYSVAEGKGAGADADGVFENAESASPADDCFISKTLAPAQAAADPPHVPLAWPPDGDLDVDWVQSLMSAFDWSSRYLPPSEFPSVLPVGMFDRLVLCASKILHKEPNCLKIDDLGPTSRVVVVGDVHGQLHDVLFLLRHAGFPSQNLTYVFNGDYVDRGAWGLETFLVLLAWKLIIRSHEGPDAREKRSAFSGMDEGYTIDHVVESGQLITLFSAPDYPQFQATEERYKNKGAYIVLEPPAFDTPTFQSFEAVMPRPKVNPYYDYEDVLDSDEELDLALMASVT